MGFAGFAWTCIDEVMRAFNRGAFLPGTGWRAESGRNRRGKCPHGELATFA